MNRGLLALCIVTLFGGAMLWMLKKGQEPNWSPVTTPTTTQSGRAHPHTVTYPKAEVMYEYFPPKDKRKEEHIVITGGAGFIGSQLGYHLHEQGYPVTLIDNMAFGYDDNLVVNGKRFGRFILGDVMDINIHKYLEGADTIFHFAALSALPVCQSNPRDSMAINVGGVSNILEGARKFGVRRFVFASTSAVYENNKEEVFTEDLKVSPHLLYSLSKYQSELLVKSYEEMYNQDAVILRFFNVYGPHQDFRRKSPPFTSYVVRELVNGRAPTLHSSGEQKRDYVFVSDLIDLAQRVMTSDRAKGETFNVASGKPYTVNEMYKIIANNLGSNIKPVYRDAGKFWDSYKELFQGAKPIKKELLVKEVNKRTTGSYAKAKELLDWEPKVSMEEGLRQMADFVKSTDAAKGKFENVAWKDDDASSSK